MTRGALASVVALLLCGGALCAGHGAPSNACYVGGALQVHSAPAGLPVTSANCDVIYAKEDFQLQPAVRFLAAKPGETYTLIMLDPDVPGLSPGLYYLHWLKANIPGGDFQCGNLNNSTEISQYVAPAPPEGSGLHRYMFYAYQHFPSNARLPSAMLNKQFQKEAFNLRNYLRKTAREGVRLRGPIVGVQFRAEFLYSPDKNN